MKEEDVPQDKESFKDRDKLKKVMYATNKSGNYTTVSSHGWEVEHQATLQAWEEVENELKEISDQIIAGNISPIAYYTKKNLMDIGLVAQHMSLWKWQVKRHLKPAIFAKLKQEVLEKYATVFNCKVDDLVNFNPNLPVKD